MTIDEWVKSPNFRHACEGRHPELFENTGFPLPASARTCFAGMTHSVTSRNFKLPISSVKSYFAANHWIPAFAGMTPKDVLRLFTKPSKLEEWILEKKRN